MSLKVPEEANAEGLKLILENSILKLGLNTERKKQRGILFHFYIHKSMKGNMFFFPKKDCFLIF